MGGPVGRGICVWLLVCIPFPSPVRMVGKMARTGLGSRFVENWANDSFSFLVYSTGRILALGQMHYLRESRGSIYYR